MPRSARHFLTRTSTHFVSRSALSHTRTTHRVTSQVRLPPTNQKGIRTYYGRRGFMKEPILQWRKGAKMTFVKPLPDGGRIHDRVYEFPRHYEIKRHFDQHDPGRAPVRHFVLDRVTHRDKTFTIPKSETSASLLGKLRRTARRLV